MYLVYLQQHQSCLLRTPTGQVVRLGIDQDLLPGDVSSLAYSRRQRDWSGVTEQPAKVLRFAAPNVILSKNAHLKKSKIRSSNKLLFTTHFSKFLVTIMLLYVCYICMQVCYAFLNTMKAHRSL